MKQMKNKMTINKILLAVAAGILLGVIAATAVLYAVKKFLQAPGCAKSSPSRF